MDDEDGVNPNYRRDFCCIETTKPAVIMMYSKGHSVDEITIPDATGTQGDPFMLLVPPVAQYLNNYHHCQECENRLHWTHQLFLAYSIL